MTYYNYCISCPVAVFCINGAEHIGLAAACYQSAIITNFKLKSKFIRFCQKCILCQKFAHNIDLIEDGIQIIFEIVLCFVNI
jgi:hypothetical protein